MGTQSFPAAIALLAIMALSSCAGGPQALSGDPDSIETSPRAEGLSGEPTPEPLPPLEGQSLFSAENAAKLQLSRLDKGIPLIIYSDPALRVRCVRIILRGSAALAEPAKPGLEALCLDLMAKGPSTLSAAEMEALLYRSKARIIADASNPDAAAYSLLVPSDRFDLAWPAFAASFSSPALRPDDFESAKLSRLSALKAAGATPEGELLAQLTPLAFEGHPYALPPEGSLEASSGIALEEVRDWHRGLLESGRVFVVAAGDFDPAGLKALVEAALGSLQAAEAPAIPRWAGSPLLRGIPLLEGQGAWLMGILPAPGFADAEGPAFRVGSRILSAQLRGRLKGAEGQTPASGTYLFDGFGAHAAILAVHVSDPFAARAWMGQAIHSISQGLFSDEELEAWKSQALAALYAQAGSVQAIAAGLGEAFLYTGRPAEYFLMADRVMAVRPAQAALAVDRWMRLSRASWGIMGAPALINSIDQALWLGE